MSYGLLSPIPRTFFLKKNIIKKRIDTLIKRNIKNIQNIKFISGITKNGENIFFFTITNSYNRKYEFFK